MPHNHLMVLDASEIVKGKEDEVEKWAIELARFVDENEPRVIAYEIFFDRSRRLMTVFQIHPDSASMEFHMDAAAPIFSRFQGSITLRTMDVFGDASDALLKRLREKAAMLGAATVVIHDLHSGFLRPSAPATSRS